MTKEEIEEIERLAFEYTERFNFTPDEMEVFTDGVSFALKLVQQAEKERQVIN